MPPPRRCARGGWITTRPRSFDRIRPKKPPNPRYRRPLLHLQAKPCAFVGVAGWSTKLDQPGRVMPANPDRRLDVVRVQLGHLSERPAVKIHQMVPDPRPISDGLPAKRAGVIGLGWAVKHSGSPERAGAEWRGAKSRGRSVAEAVARPMDRDQLVGRPRVHREGVDRLRTEQRRALGQIANDVVMVAVAGQIRALLLSTHWLLMLDMNVKRYISEK
jgi:hypothetical protein